MTDLIKNNPFSNFYRGFFTPFRAGRFVLNNPRLLKYVLIPFLINTVVFSVAVYFGLDFFNDTVIYHIPHGDAWYWLLLYYLLWIIAVLATAVLVFFSFTVVGNLVASPFNDLLSERTEQLLTGEKTDEPFSLRIFWRDTRRTLAVEIKKMSAFVAGMVLLLLLNLVPVVGNILYPLFAILLTLFFLVVEYLGYVLARKHYSFRDQSRYIFSRTLLMSGFGTGVLAILTIPFLQFFCIPVAVIGATQLWCETADQESQVARKQTERNA
jgi:CysZ protein